MRKSDIKEKTLHIHEEHQLGHRQVTSVLIFSISCGSSIKHTALSKFPTEIFLLCGAIVSWLLVFCFLSSLLFDDTDQMEGASGAENPPGKVINIRNSVVYLYFTFIS